LPRADIAGEGLPKRLLDGGALEVLDLPLYRTLPVEALPADVVADLDAGRIDWACFTSSSTARNLVDLLGGTDKLTNVRIASIGEKTTATLRELGLPIDAEAHQPTLDNLVAAVRRSVEASTTIAVG
ncbi:MAG: uroporphyrinogen-III synthase, partial [Planctomycetota bacterium]